MSFLNVLWYYLFIAPHLLMVGVLFAMWRRRLARSFPWFFAYVAVEVLQFCILFPCYLRSIDGAVYFRIYMACMAVSTALRFAIIADAIRHLFRNTPALQESGRQVFRWLAVTLLLTGLVIAAYARGDVPDRLWYLVQVLNRTALIVQMGLLIALFAITKYLGLSWRNQMLGICLGLGFYACIDLIASAIRSQTGTTYNVLLNFIYMGAYHVSVVIWLVYSLARERVPLRATPMDVTHAETEAWSRELERLLHP